MLKTTFNIKATSNWVKFSIKNEKNKVLYKIKNCPVAIIASDKYKENAVRIRAKASFSKVYSYNNISL